MILKRNYYMANVVKNIQDIAKEVLEIEGNAVLKLREFLNKDFETAVEILYNCKGRVIVTGMGKSGLVGKKISATLSSTGTPSYFLHPAESTHGDSGIITREDVVIAISNSGETRELLNLLPIIKRFGLKIIALCGKSNSTLANASDAFIDVSVEKEACPLNKAPTASTTATLAMGDALAICLLEKKGFSKEDFLIFHPSGALGKASMYRVKDLMNNTRNIPLVSVESDFMETVGIISEHRLGFAIMVDYENKLQGILTDGDIRRVLMKYKNVQDLKIKDVMVKNPKTVDCETFAVGALHLMEKYSITALPVVDKNNLPIGVLHIHDLLKAGVV